MGMSKVEQEHLEDLLGRYPFRERFQRLLTQMQDILEALGLLEKVTINLDLLGQAVLNYFEDIDRLKSFEGINKVNEDKIYAYTTFWLLREKPIQLLTDEVAYDSIFVNEKVYTAILISKMLCEAEINPDSSNPRLMPYIKLLYYNFKYRNFTQQSLELMVSAFFCGCKFLSNKEDSDT